MVKEIILIVLLFNGEVSLRYFPFEGTVHECFEYGAELRMELTEHKWIEEDIMKSGWYLKDGTGIWQGFICN